MRIWYKGDLWWEEMPVKGPIIGFWARRGVKSYYIIELKTVSDITWCYDKPIQSFTAENYSPVFQMGPTAYQQTLTAYYDWWNTFSHFCQLEIKIISVTHQIHKGETNLLEY